MFEDQKLASSKPISVRHWRHTLAVASGHRPPAPGGADPEATAAIATEVTSPCSLPRGFFAYGTRIPTAWITLRTSGRPVVWSLMCLCHGLAGSADFGDAREFDRREHQPFPARDVQLSLEQRGPSVPRSLGFVCIRCGSSTSLDNQAEASGRKTLHAATSGAPTGFKIALGDPEGGFCQQCLCPTVCR